MGVHEKLRAYVSGYYRELMNMPGRIEDVAYGFAIGVFIAFTPLLGLHTVLALALAWALGRSAAASLLGTLLFNPATGPFILGLDMAVGSTLLKILEPGKTRIFSHSASTLLGLWKMGKEAFISCLAGGAVLGLVAAGLSFFMVKSALTAYRLKFYEKRQARKGTD